MKRYRYLLAKLFGILPISNRFLKNHSWSYPDNLKKEDVKTFLDGIKGKKSKIIYLDPKAEVSVINPLTGLDSSNPEHLKLKKDYLEMVKEMNGGKEST